MNARENFYSSVFEAINSYKHQGHEKKVSSGLFSDHLAESGVFAAGLLFAVFSGFAFTFPNYMKFDRPFLGASPPQIAVSIPDDSYAAVPVSVPLSTQLMPSADTYVSTASANKNFGDQKLLRVQSKPATQALLSFSLPSQQKINRAYLVLPARTQSAAVDVFVSRSYVFDEMTYNNNDIPVSGFELVSMISDTSFPARIDVTGYVSQTRMLSVLLRSRSGTVIYDSREAGSPDVPTLMIE